MYIMCACGQKWKDVSHFVHYGSMFQEGTGPAIFCFIPLVVTIAFHRYLARNIIGPLKNLSLEVAADVDIQEGELSKAPAQEEEESYAALVEHHLYGQPCLKASADERGPMPYRRDDTKTMPEV